MSDLPTRAAQAWALAATREDAIGECFSTPPEEFGRKVAAVYLACQQEMLTPPPPNEHEPVGPAGLTASEVAFLMRLQTAMGRRNVPVAVADAMYALGKALRGITP